MGREEAMPDAVAAGPLARRAGARPLARCWPGPTPPTTSRCSAPHRAGRTTTMRQRTTRRRTLAGAAAAAVASPVVAGAQDLPSDRPVRIVVPTGAGGITDILARIVAGRLSARLERPVVVDNRPGASGVIGTEAVVRARPDGTTLLMVYPSHTANPSLKARLPYDTERDL